VKQQRAWKKALGSVCLSAAFLIAAFAEEKTIVVVEKSANADDKTNHEDNGKGLPAGAKAVEASDLKDAAAKITGELKAGDCIKRLDFRGHGASGMQSVGDGVNREAGKYINTGKEEWKTELAGLKGKFCKDAVIHLWGCNTGSCDTGASKLKEIADFFGVKARGAVNTVIAGQQESYTGPVQEADPDKPKPEHKAATDEAAPARPNNEQKCDTNADGDIDVTDIQTVLNGRNQRVNGPDPRDADSDGLLTTNDARMCVNRCTRPRCQQ
jgi:hypothetical protein